MLCGSSVALITGGSKGIGLAIAKRILDEEATVVIVDMDKTEGEKCAQQLQLKYGANKVIFVPCDVTNQRQLASAFDLCTSRFGRLDIVVNNAGIGDVTMFGDKKAQEDEMPKDWQKIIDVNLTAVINGTRLAYRAMLRNPAACMGGCIINISSLGGFFPQPYSPIYCATKHALIGFTRSLAPLRKQGIRVNALAPGFTQTSLVTSAMQSGRFKGAVDVATQVYGGLMSVEDVAEGAMMLIEDEKIAGKVLSVSRELRGYSLHDSPTIVPGGSHHERHPTDSPFQVLNLPHRVIKPLIRSKL